MIVFGDQVVQPAGHLGARPRRVEIGVNCRNARCDCDCLLLLLPVLARVTRISIKVPVRIMLLDAFAAMMSCSLPPFPQSPNIPPICGSGPKPIPQPPSHDIVSRLLSSHLACFPLHRSGGTQYAAVGHLKRLK